MFSHTFLALTQLGESCSQSEKGKGGGGLGGRRSEKNKTSKVSYVRTTSVTLGVAPQCTALPMYANATIDAWYTAKGKGQTWWHCRDFRHHHKSHYNIDPASEIKVQRNVNCIVPIVFSDCSLTHVKFGCKDGDTLDTSCATIMQITGQIYFRFRPSHPSVVLF